MLMITEVVVIKAALTFQVGNLTARLVDTRKIMKAKSAQTTV